MNSCPGKTIKMKMSLYIVNYVSLTSEKPQILNFISFIYPMLFFSVSQTLHPSSNLTSNPPSFLVVHSSCILSTISRQTIYVRCLLTASTPPSQAHWPRDSDYINLPVFTVCLCAVSFFLSFVNSFCLPSLYPIIFTCSPFSPLYPFISSLVTVIPLSFRFCLHL